MTSRHYSESIRVPFVDFTRRFIFHGTRRDRLLLSVHPAGQRVLFTIHIQRAPFTSQKAS